MIVVVAVLAVVLVARTAADHRAKASTVDVTVRVSVCNANGAQCASLGVPGAVVSVTAATGPLGQGKTDDAGRVTVAFHYAGDFTVQVTSALLAGGSASTVASVESGGAVSWSVLRPLAPGYAPSPR
jgi:hypothetical protein